MNIINMWNNFGDLKIDRLSVDMWYLQQLGLRKLAEGVGVWVCRGRIREGCMYRGSFAGEPSCLDNKMSCWLRDCLCSLFPKHRSGHKRKRDRNGFSEDCYFVADMAQCDPSAFNFWLLIAYCQIFYLLILTSNNCRDEQAKYFLARMSSLVGSLNFYLLFFFTLNLFFLNFFRENKQFYTHCSLLRVYWIP